jgi:hypothetical protein
LSTGDFLDEDFRDMRGIWNWLLFSGLSTSGDRTRAEALRR